MGALFIGAQEQPVSATPQQQEQPTPAEPQQAAQEQKEQILPQFTKPQLEELVASIALYPDDLLAQVLAASTYPVDIVEAARWIKRNPSLDQDGINTELKSKKWDPSVKGLIFFSELLAKMNDNMDWTKDLGDAFLTQQKDVMDTIQVMRGKAQAAGYLKSDSNQKVTTTAEGQTEIQSTNPETVYVQDYMPSEAYGSDWGHNDDYEHDYYGYSGINSAPVWPSRRGYACAWALGYKCGWGKNSGLAYNNAADGSFYKNNLQNANINSENRGWSNDRANARSLSPDAQQAAKQLQSDNRTAQNFNKGDSAASKELKQNLQEGDRTQAAKSAIQNTERAQTAKAEAASRALNQSAAPGGARAETAKAALQNTERVQNAKTVAQVNPRPSGQPAMSGSRNANAERAYSSRGAQSRTVSAHTNNKGGAVKSRAGSAPKAARSTGGGNKAGAAARR
jgi:hypothetical protein